MIPEDAVEAAAGAFREGRRRGDLGDALMAALEAAAPHMTPIVDASAIIAELRLFNHHQAADLIERLTTQHDNEGEK